MAHAGVGGTRQQRVLRALTPLLVNLGIGVVLRLALPYTVADSGERYRYYAMSLFFPIADCPSFHCFRVLPPLLTSLLPLEVIDSFIVTGFVFQVLAGVMLWLIAEHLHQSRRVAAYAVAWYWVTWAPIQTFGDPLLITDPIAAFWSLTALYLLLERRYVLALIVLVSGATVKEGILLVPLIYAVYAFISNDPARRKPVWLTTLIAAPLVTWLLLRMALSAWFGYVSYQDESYVRQTYFFGLWLPNLAPFPKNLLVAALYIFGACGAAWVLGPLGLQQANRRQRALSIAALPAMLFLALYQVPDRALATFPYATLLPAALVLSRLPSVLNIALLAANAAFSIRMNTAAPWVPRMPIALALVVALTVVAVWLDVRRGRSGPVAAAPVTSPPMQPAAAWMSAVTIMVLVGAVSFHTWRANAAQHTVNWTTGPSAVLVDDDGNTPAFAASPDGQSIAFVAAGLGGGRATRRLWRGRVGSSPVVALEGTDGAAGPFWSPDGAAIGFFADRKLKTLDLASGTVRVLADVAIARGGAWSQRGVIVFAADLTGGLSQVPATGGPATAVTTLDRARGEQSHRWPAFLPDGRHFVFAARAARRQDDGLYLGTLGSADRRLISGDRSNAAYAGPGFLWIARDDGLWRQPFDLARLKLVSYRENIARIVYASATRRGAFAVSDHLLVFARERAASTADPKSHLEWVDGRGRLLGVERSTDMPGHVELSHDVPGSQIDRLPDGGIVTSRSPDGRVVLAQKRTRKRPDAPPAAWNVWIQPLTRGSDAVPLVNDGYNHTQAQFSPDGRWIAYTSDEGSADEVYVQPYPQTGERWQVSIDGGAQPRWRNISEIVYVANDRFVRVVSIDTQPRFRAGSPRPLFEVLLRPTDRATRLFQYAIASDGDRFLLNVADAPAEPAPITVVSGWRAGQRLP